MTENYKSNNNNCKSNNNNNNNFKQKQQKHDDIIQSIAAGNKQPLIPHLEFEYSDVGIHEDLYKLVRYSCEELFSSKELLNKIMRLWSTFLEPMLGVPSQSHGTERAEEQKNQRKPGKTPAWRSAQGFQDVVEEKGFSQSEGDSLT